ncbi:Homoserine O-acetyltransferase [Nostocoides japonicum T1-X7]|uniref:Homoserine O-acetyltransferase n=1 Tax=Nostocoides japonicum T1-X7 TaxID=1194083 RepID=A0A077LUP6_9MICO|nr:Homoserine O-acetyltransferase [Tetrasphaera japonica T1-X7]
MSVIVEAGPAGPGRIEDPPGDRRYLSVGPVDLETGGHLPDVVVAYESWGTLDAERSNAILIEHALTGDTHVVGPMGPGHPSPGWWEGLIGPGRPLDTDRFFVVATNVLGGCRGTTGPASAHPDGRPWGGRFPYVTTRDQVAVEALFADALGIDRWAGVVGGSMGGMRVLEWAVAFPERVAAAVALASTAYATADQIAWCHPQIVAIESDPDFQGGDYYGTGRAPETGLGIARRIAHITYRSDEELSGRFGRDAQTQLSPVGEGGQFAVESYLDHHAGKLAGRFDANSYVVLTRSMNSHDVGRGRGSVAAALATVTARTLVVAIDSDRLYPVRLSREIAEAVPGARLAVLRSPHGHDGFLLETALVGDLLREHLLPSGRPIG